MGFVIIYGGGSDNQERPEKLSYGILLMQSPYTDVDTEVDVHEDELVELGIDRWLLLGT